MTFHIGEKAIQEQLGVRAMAERVGNSIGARVPIVAQNWLRTQQLAAATTIAPEGDVWVSLLTGEKGFLEPLNETTLSVKTSSIEYSMLSNLQNNSAIGLVVLEPSARKRMRINGAARFESGALVVSAQQVYANCPKYIQARGVVKTQNDTASEVLAGRALSSRQQSLISSADTFFIGSVYNGSADASHRGGNPGFVEIVNETHLRWLDYPGNAMFNTFGNLHQNSHCGLLFVDWENGHALQLTGKALLKREGAQMSVDFALAQCRETPNASPLRWHLDEFSPFNPTF